MTSQCVATVLKISLSQLLLLLQAANFHSGGHYTSSLYLFHSCEQLSGAIQVAAGGGDTAAAAGGRQSRIHILSVFCGEQQQQ